MTIHHLRRASKAAAMGGLLPLLQACAGPAVDQIKDPVEKAAWHCRYVLERAVATPEQMDADGVLRREIATFGDPEVSRMGEVVRFTWADGSIVAKDRSGAYGGECVMDVANGQQLVVSAALDGQPLHAGFRF